MFTKKDELLFKVKASPFFWRQKAEELKYASEIIWPHAIARLDKLLKSIEDKVELKLTQIEPDTFAIYLSLTGFSIECLFKASVIRDNPSFVSNGTLSRKLSIHNLIDLAKLAKIKLLQHEQIFCRQAYRAMVVDSRYPIAKEAEPIKGIIEIGGNCKDVFNTLYNRLHPTVGQFTPTKTKQK